MEQWSKYGVAKSVWCSKFNVAASGSGSRVDGWLGWGPKEASAA